MHGPTEFEADINKKKLILIELFQDKSKFVVILDFSTIFNILAMDSAT